MSDRDLWLARRLGDQLRDLEASGPEIAETIEAAFTRTEERSAAYAAAYREDYLTVVGRRLRERIAAAKESGHDRLSKDHSSRQRPGIRQQGVGSVGVSPGRHPRLQQAGQAHRQCVIESLDGKFRAECLNANWFMSLDEAQRKCEAWRRHYNEHRPHSAIGQQVPIQLHLPSGKPSQPVVR